MKPNHRTRSFILVLLTLVSGVFLVFTLFPSPEIQSLHAGATVDDNTGAISTLRTNSPKQSSQQNTKQIALEEEFLTESVTKHLLDIAQIYETQIRYPHFSTPVIDLELAKSPAPFEQARVSSPTFDEQGKPLALTLSASTDKLDYARGDLITIQLVLDGIDNVHTAFAFAEIRSVDSKRTDHNRIQLLPLENHQFELRASVDSEQLDIAANAAEFLAVIAVEVEGREHLTTVPFTVNQISAELLTVSEVRQHDEFLEMTLDFTVDQAGYYFVHAYLDDAKTLTPLLVLQGEGKMKANSDQLVLKAHHQALKDAGSQGPYSLRVVQVFRGAEPGEANDVMASISQQRYAIPDFDFNGYSNTPYENPTNTRRLEALRSLASND